MYKFFLSSLLLTLFVIGRPAYAVKLDTPAAINETLPQEAEKSFQIEHSTVSSKDKAAIQEVLSRLLSAANEHNIDALLKYYSPHFISGDSLSLKEVKELVETTWKSFPDVQYKSEILDLRLNGQWATVESIDHSMGSAQVDPLISDSPGKMSSESRAVLYLHKVGKHWEIVSDATLYEKALIVYGPFESLDISVQAPDQVFAGDDYTAKMFVKIPDGTIGFASLSQEPLTHPHQPSTDKFRTVSTQKGDLERIFSANKTHNNEVVTATVGVTQIGQDNQDRPLIQFKGVVTVVKRVNVISKSAFKPGNNEPKLVQTSADGKIDFSSEKEKSSAVPFSKRQVKSSNF